MNIIGSRIPTPGVTFRAAAMVISFVLGFSSAPFTQAQTFQVIHSFANHGDGNSPEAGLSADSAGNLYGTTSGECGTVFRLSYSYGNWNFSNIESFGGGSDGCDPLARVVFGPDGSLYGTTIVGGGSGCGSQTALGLGCGTVFDASTQSVIYRFTGAQDGWLPATGDLAFDTAGNIYGANVYGGHRTTGCFYDLRTNGCGVVYELSPSGSGWSENTVYSFMGGADGFLPRGVVVDRLGNLFGTTYSGGNSHCDHGCGTVFELTHSASGWTKKILYSFQGGSDGGVPLNSLTIDPAGNLYGATGTGGQNGSGTIYELSPTGANWTFTVLYNFLNYGARAQLTLDASGNLYGTTLFQGAYGDGSVFKLTKQTGGWTFTPLHDFSGGSDGGSPTSNVTFDANGNLYGTASSGGAYYYGVVWEIRVR